MHGGHETRVCKHGRVVSTCRCPDPGKRIVLVPCGPDCPGSNVESGDLCVSCVTHRLARERAERRHDELEASFVRVVARSNKRMEQLEERNEELDGRLADEVEGRIRSQREARILRKHMARAQQEAADAAIARRDDAR